jgi:hypothetical protein
MVAGALEGSCATKRLLVHEVLQVAGGRGSRGSGEEDVVLGAESAFESARSFTEHAGDHFFLAFIELPSQAVVKLGFGDQELDKLLCVRLSIEDRLGKIDEPAGNLVPLVAALQQFVVGLAATIDGER